MAYGTLKVDTIVYDNNGSEASVTTQDLTNKASLASPAFTGTPTAPNAAGYDSSTQIATTAFVGTAITRSKEDWETGAPPTTADSDNHKRYFIDTSSAVQGIALPDSATYNMQEGETVTFADQAGTWNTNNFTIAPGVGDNINGNSGNLVCNVQYATVKLTWSGVASVGWLVK